MTIKSLLKISIAIVIIAVLSLSATNWAISSKLAEISLAQELSQTSNHAIANLLVLTHEYALHAEERAAQQWRTQHAVIIAKLEEGKNYAVPPPQEALAEAKLLPEIFTQLTGATDGSDMHRRQRELLLNQLLSSCQVLADTIHRWGQSTTVHRRQIEHYSGILIIAVPFLNLIVLAMLIMLVNRRILAPLTTLRQAVQAVAHGDLSVRSATNTNDEFGELSRTFDAMAIEMVSDLRQEITERRRAEEALKESEYFFKESQKAAHVGSYKADFIAGYWHSSEVLDNIFGIDEQYNRSIQGWLDIVHPDDREMMRRYLNGEVIAGKNAFAREYRIVRQIDGETRWVYGLGQLRFDDAGNAIYLTGTIQDVTERKQMEAEKAALEDQLLKAQKLESLGVLAGGIAHDFNNILTAIIGNAELALLRLSHESPIVENLRNIEQAATRAADLAKQMLAYSGRGKFVVRNICLNTLLQEMRSMLNAAVSKKADLRFNLHHDLPLVEADAIQMRQMIINLVTNASEALDDHSGAITISTGCMECERSYLKDAWLNEDIPDGRYVYMEIADTGCGMDSETIAKIFDPFFTTKFTGRGLGMAAVIGIIRGHRGTIKINSEPGKGSAFRILLPACTVPLELPESNTANSDGKGDGIVLLVDDEETVRDVASEMLKELGFIPITASDGQEALTIFRETPDVAFILLDLTMPNMDGEQCFFELRKIRPDARVIMSSGFTEQEVTRKFAGKGLAGFVQKPYRLTELKKAVFAV